MSYRIQSELCSCCHQCKVHCPNSAIRFSGFKYQIDAEKCVDCGVCAEICHNGIITKVGEELTPPEKHDKIRLNCDVAIAGAGASGLIAAARLARAGKKVIVLEKAARAGGNSVYATGFIPHYSKKHASHGIPDTRDDDLRKYISSVKWQVDHRLVCNAMRATENLTDWMIDELGCDEAFQIADGPGNKPTIMLTNKLGPKIPRPDTSIGPGSGSFFIVHKMKQTALELGVTILYRHEAKKIITDDDGGVCGILAEDPGGETEISCKACVLATGSFSHDKELRERVNPETAAPGEPIHIFSVPTCTGDGVRMAQETDAEIDYENMSSVCFGPAHHPFAFSLTTICRESEPVFINLDGKRWCSEANSMLDLRHLFTKQPRCLSWAVVDSNIAEMCAQRLIDQGRDGEDGVRLLRGYKDDIAEESRLETPTTKSADTMEELAELIGADTDKFVSEIKRYNEFCRNGRDEDFFKDPSALVPLEKPPFTAMICKRFQENARGGIVTDSWTRALRKDGCALTGLYAIGDNARGVVMPGDVGIDLHYPCMSPVTWACASGMMAADAVLSDLAGGC